MKYETYYSYIRKRSTLDFAAQIRHLKKEFGAEIRILQINDCPECAEPSLEAESPPLTIDNSIIGWNCKLMREIREYS